MQRMLNRRGGPVDSLPAHSRCAASHGEHRLDAMATKGELDWDDLRYFLRAAQNGTLAGAARAMGVEHTTIGRRLSALETALGAPLVLRAADGLHLTPLGAHMLPLVEDIERAVRVVQEQATQQPARVRLAMPSGFTKLFTAHLGRLRDAQPRVSLELLTGSKTVDLQKGEADIAIRSGPVSDESLIARKLCDSGWSLYAAATYLARHPAPVTVTDLRGHDLIGYDLSLASVPAAQWIEQRAGDARIVMRSREMTDMLEATLSGAGLALLPCLLGDAEPALVRLTSEVLASREVWLVYPGKARRSAAVQSVARFVIEVMRDNAGRVSGRAPSPARGRD
jgi:DNA-binding transcriptional LysR family regulator